MNEVDEIYDMLLHDRLDFSIRIDRLEQSEKFKVKMVFATVTWLVCLSAAVIKGIL